MSRPTALPLPAAIALLSAALVLSIWASFGLGDPLLLLLGAAGVAALATLYMFAYAKRPMRDPLIELVAPEEFDDPVIEADRAAGSPPETTPPPGPAPPPVATSEPTAVGPAPIPSSDLNRDDP
jgi:hypothetical protein